MPKPVKKSAKKRPSAAAMVRARQLMDEHMQKAGSGRYAEPNIDTDAANADWPKRTPDVKAIISEHMRQLGAKGGKVSGAKRMEMPAGKRKAIATKAARARWAKPRV